jgi:hypothetical protein
MVSEKLRSHEGLWSLTGFSGLAPTLVRQLFIVQHCFRSMFR